MNSYAIAAELLGDLELSPEQHAQLRAIDYRYQLELQWRLQTHAGRETVPEQPSSRNADAESGMSPEEFASARARLVDDILDMLTPAQRAVLNRR